MNRKRGNMAHFVAFLRAINVGGHTVKMNRLCQLFEEMGFIGVETFIASGNVIFHTTHSDLPALEKRIEATLQQALGYEVATFIRPLTELATVAQYKPFADLDLQESHALYVAFLKDIPDGEGLQRLFVWETVVDRFHVCGREVYWLCRHKMSESKFSGNTLEKSLKMPATLRNITTIQKIIHKYTPSSP